DESLVDNVGRELGAAKAALDEADGDLADARAAPLEERLERDQPGIAACLDPLERHLGEEVGAQAGEAGGEITDGHADDRARVPGARQREHTPPSAPFVYPPALDLAGADHEIVIGRRGHQ